MFYVLSIVWGALCLYLLCYALLCVNSSFAITLKMKRNLVALLLLSYRCIGYYKCSVALPHGAWVGLQYVTVVFPDHTHLLFSYDVLKTKLNPIPFIALTCMCGWLSVKCEMLTQ